MAVEENQERARFIAKVRSILVHDIENDKPMFIATIRFIKRIISAVKKEISGENYTNIQNFSSRELEIHRRSTALVDLLLQFEDSRFTKKLSRPEALNLALNTVLINPEFDISSERNAHKRYALKALILESKGQYSSISQVEPTPAYENFGLNYGAF